MPGFVGKRVRSYNGFIGRYSDAGNLRQQLARGIQFVEMEIRGHAEGGLPHAQGYGDFFERRIARPFTNSIDRQLKLACAAANSGQ